MRKTQKIKRTRWKVMANENIPHPEDDSAILVQGTSYFYYYS